MCLPATTKFGKVPSFFFYYKNKQISRASEKQQGFGSIYNQKNRKRRQQTGHSNYSCTGTDSYSIFHFSHTDEKP